MPKIKDIHKIEQSREKLEKYGPEKLFDFELLAILLRTGLKGTNVLDLSKKILRKFKNGKIPTGDIEPSEDDIEITKKLVSAGKILGIKVVDYVIVTKDNFFSFKEKEII